MDDLVKLPDVRRFELGDLSVHGGWVMERLLKRWPSLSEINIAGFLRGVIGSNEYLFLASDGMVGLAQTLREFWLAPKIVREHFVLARPGMEREAAVMYHEFARWAKQQGIHEIYLARTSDVPQDLIRNHVGRIYNVTQSFARV